MVYFLMTYVIYLCLHLSLCLDVCISLHLSAMLPSILPHKYINIAASVFYLFVLQLLCFLQIKV